MIFPPLLLRARLLLATRADGLVSFGVSERREFINHVDVAIFKDSLPFSVCILTTHVRRAHATPCKLRRQRPGGLSGQHS